MSINDLLTFESLYLLLAWLFGSGGSHGVLEKKSRVANFRVNPSFFLVLASYILEVFQPSLFLLFSLIN